MGICVPARGPSSDVSPHDAEQGSWGEGPVYTGSFTCYTVHSTCEHRISEIWRDDVWILNKPFRREFKSGDICCFWVVSQ
jgi:hypothetical protein